MTETFIAIGLFLVGFILGAILSVIILRKKTKPVGSLRMDYTDPDGPYLFLELTNDPNSIKDKDCVTLKVDISQN